MIRQLRPSLCPDRPSYGKRRRPILTPRIQARRLIARITWGQRSFAPYRIMILRRYFKP